MKVHALMVGLISSLAGSDAWNTFDGKIGDAMKGIFELGNAIDSQKFKNQWSFTINTKKLRKILLGRQRSGPGIRIRQYPCGGH